MKDRHGTAFPDHDPRFDRGFRLAQRGVGCFSVVFLVQAMMGLALTIAVVAVAWHFIAKFW